jgi:hypothetical protein
VRKFCVKRIYNKIPGQKKFCGIPLMPLFYTSELRNKNLVLYLKSWEPQIVLEKKNSLAIAAKRVMEGKKIVMPGVERDSQEAEHQQLVWILQREKRKKPKTTSNKGWRKQRNMQKQFLPVRWRGNHGLRLRISSVIIGSIIHERHICCTRLSPPPPYNLTKYEELEEATLKPNAMARTR